MFYLAPLSKFNGVILYIFAAPSSIGVEGSFSLQRFSCICEIKYFKLVIWILLFRQQIAVLSDGRHPSPGEGS